MDRKCRLGISHHHLAARLLAPKNIDLVFEGLDAYAKVYLNDKLLPADNMFREWRVDVKPDLKAGANYLRVVFPSPIKARPRSPPPIPGATRPTPKTRPIIRKAAYEYGWDWGPRFVTSGIWRPARLEAWDTARNSNFNLHLLDVSGSVAHLQAEVEVTATEDAPKPLCRLRTSAKARTHAQLNSPRPQPRRFSYRHKESLSCGIPPATARSPSINSMRNSKTTASAEDRHRKTGLRSVVLRREPDQWGRSFEFVINGIPVFGKGADVIPFDSFPTRVTTAQYRRILQSAVDANMNMIRHWGGGHYETDEFYDLCDELGIMVWQDFMFGNDWQPGTSSAERRPRSRRPGPPPAQPSQHRHLVRQQRNRRLPCLARATRQGLSADVLSRCGRITSPLQRHPPAAVNRLAPETPYWPSSPSADYETSPRQAPATSMTGPSGTAAFPSPNTKSTTRAS